MIEELIAFIGAQDRGPWGYPGPGRELEVSNLTRVAGGLSRETWSFDLSWTEDGGRRTLGLIMRRDPDASLLESDRRAEFGVLRAVGPTVVPVPAVRWLDPTSEWTGHPFFVMDRIEGETSPALLLADPRYAPARARFARRKVEILADLHRIEWEPGTLAPLVAPDPEDCAAHEIAQWEAVIDAQELEPQPLLRGAIEWMRQHLPPPPSRVGLVHGDYRTGNLMYTDDGEIAAVLDWELAHLGDPLEDVAYVATCRFTPEGQLGGVGLVGGLFELEDFYARYEEASGAPIDRRAVAFWQVLANVKIAAISLTGVRSFCDGRTRDLQMALLGGAAHAVGLTAHAIIDAERRARDESSRTLR